MIKKRIPDVVALLAWMRGEGVLHARVGDVELTIDPSFVPAGASDDKPRPRIEEPVYASPLDDPELYDNGHVPMLPKLNGKDGAP